MYILEFVTSISFFPVFYFLIKNHPSTTHHLQIYTYARQRNTKREKNGVFLRRKAIAGKKFYRRIDEPIPRILTPSPTPDSQGIIIYKGIEISRLYFNITTRNKQIYRYQYFHPLRLSTTSAETHLGPKEAHNGPMDSSSASTEAPYTPQSPKYATQNPFSAHNKHYRPHDYNTIKNKSLYVLLRPL